MEADLQMAMKYSLSRINQHPTAIGSSHKDIIKCTMSGVRCTPRLIVEEFLTAGMKYTGYIKCPGTGYSEAGE
jgi:hypothetical protein